MIYFMVVARLANFFSKLKNAKRAADVEQHAKTERRKANSFKFAYGCFLLFDTNSRTNRRSKIIPTTANPTPI